MDITEQELADLIGELLEENEDELDAAQPGAQIRSVRTFAERGLMTTDAGIVLRLVDGSEFQITVVRAH